MVEKLAEKYLTEEEKKKIQGWARTNCSRHCASGWPNNSAASAVTTARPIACCDSDYARFGNFPPVLYWRGTVKGFQALMMQALERGTPLTAGELMKVQGLSEPPPEAKT